ncbi:MAG: 50S ribosomal protein L24 [Clostridiales bacterium]|nr:50S ribosomal protein L24 [Clostridiales bacterium]
MANKIHVKKDDQVLVISGKDKGSTGKVLKTEPETGRVFVEGVNMIKKHQKARSQTEVGGIIDREGSVDASNVKLVCPKCGKATRVAHVVNSDGSKDRVCKKCGAVIDQIKKAK